MLKPNQLDRVSIVKPCKADWDGMVAGEGHQRFCDSCQRVVHDLSTLTPKEAAALVNRSADSGLCARIGYDARGRMVFAREVKTNALERLVQLSVLGISALGSQAFAQAATQVCNVTVNVKDLTGEPIPGARVSMGQAQGDLWVIPDVVTDPAGIAHTMVAAGHHSLRVGAVGFKEYTNSDVAVKCDREAATVVNVNLGVGFFIGEVAIEKSYRGPMGLVRRAWDVITAPIRRVLRPA